MQGIGLFLPNVWLLRLDLPSGKGGVCRVLLKFNFTRFVHCYHLNLMSALPRSMRLPSNISQVWKHTEEVTNWVSSLYGTSVLQRWWVPIQWNYMHWITWWKSNASTYLHFLCDIAISFTQYKRSWKKSKSARQCRFRKSDEVFVWGNCSGLEAECLRLPGDMYTPTRNHWLHFEIRGMPS